MLSCVLICLASQSTIMMEEVFVLRVWSNSTGHIGGNYYEISSDNFELCAVCTSRVCVCA